MQHSEVSQRCQQHQILEDIKTRRHSKIPILRVLHPINITFHLHVAMTWSAAIKGSRNICICRSRCLTHTCICFWSGNIHRCWFPSLRSELNLVRKSWVPWMYFLWMDNVGVINHLCGPLLNGKGHHGHRKFQHLWMDSLMIECLRVRVRHTNIVMRQYGTSLAGKVWLFHRGNPSGEDGL